MSRICICKHCKKNKQFIDYYEFRDLYKIRDESNDHKLALYYPHPSDKGYVTTNMWFKRFMYESSFWGFVSAVLETNSLASYDDVGEYSQKYNGICGFTENNNKYFEAKELYKDSMKKMYKDIFNVDVDIKKIERFNKSSRAYIKNLFKRINIDV